MTALLALALSVGPGCAVLGERLVAEAQLDAARTVAIQKVETIPVSDLSALGSDYTPLGERLALVEVATRSQLAALCAAAPALRAEPDLARGMLVGVVSWLGTPVAGERGVELVGLKYADGAGLLSIRYPPGTYLPDGAATLSVGYVPVRARVLVVTVGATRYYVEEGDER